MLPLFSLLNHSLLGVRMLTVGAHITSHPLCVLRSLNRLHSPNASLIIRPVLRRCRLFYWIFLMQRGQKSWSGLMNAELCSRSYQMKAWTGKNSGHKFLFSYLIMWISVRKPALLGHNSPRRIQYKTLTCIKNAGHRQDVFARLHCRKGRARLRCSQTHGPTITAGRAVTSCKLCFAVEPETEQWECTVNWKRWGRPAEVMQ